MREQRDLYDENRNLTKEKIYKEDVIPENKYIMTVTVFIENSKNRFLIQKRSNVKGGKYGFISGHPKSGETSLQGIVSEIKEEIGININEKELNFCHYEKGINSFFDFYYLKKDIDFNFIILQKEEVDDVIWLSLTEIENLIRNGKFYKNHIEAFEILKRYTN